MGIVQDHEGFMWFASSKGLYRYDSNTFKKYIPEGGKHGSIPSDYIEDVYCDSEGRLWVATLGGLSLYDRESDSFTTFRHDPGNPGSLSSNRVLCIVQDSEETIWIGTARGLNEVVIEKEEIRFARAGHKLTDSTQLIRSMVAGKKGELWLGTGQGLVWAKRDEARLIPRNNNKQDLPAGQINAMHLDKQGTIWLGTDAGLVRLDTASKQFYPVEGIRYNEPYSAVCGIAEDNNKNLWIATESGLFFLNPANNHIKRYVRERGNYNSLADDVLYAVYVDRRNGLWLGSYYLGISYLDMGLPDFTKWPGNLDDDRYESFLNGWIGKSGSNRMWAISGNHSELISFNREGSSFVLSDLSALQSARYHTFFIDKSGILWCGADFLLTSFDLHTRKTTHHRLSSGSENKSRSGRVHTIFEDSRGTLWVGGVFGLMSYNRVTGDIEKADCHDIIYSALEDAAGNLWFGGNSFVFVVKAGTNTVKALDIDRVAFSDNPTPARRIAQDPSGRIWVASEQGLQLYDVDSDKLKLYTKDAPEILNYTLDVQADSLGYLWLNGEYRLIRYHPDKRTVQVYDYRDGLPQNGLLMLGSSVKDESGYLYFPTSNGTFRFDPEKIKPLNKISPIVLTSLKLFNKQVSAGDQTGILKSSVESTGEIVFRYDQNTFALEFALLSFSRSERNQYAYRLDGFEKDWNHVEIPAATYTNLPPGDYIFNVKAADGDGYWNPEPLQLRIIVLPPWWKTWWAYAIYVILASLLIYGVVRFFWLRNTFRKENELYEAKLDFFTNISHEIRTHLSLISSPIQQAFQLSSSNDEAQKILRYAKNNSDRLMLLVNELLDFRKLQNGKIQLHVSEQDVVKVLGNTLAAFEHLAKEKDITTRFDAPDTPVLAWFDLTQMQKVFYNLLSNTYKFTPEGGQVLIVVAEEINQVSIKIADNGVGIAPQHLEHLFRNFFQVYEGNNSNTGYGIGLALSKSIIDLHHGHLSVTSKQKTETSQGGTAFIIRLSTGADHFGGSTIHLGTSDVQPHNLQPGQSGILQETMPSVNPSKKYTLLIIEDNDELRDFSIELFRDKYQILEADNGQKGVELAKEHMPDLVVCDVMMPGVNGLEVCKQLKESFNTRHIPVILVSARSTGSQMKEGLNAGADDYLIKPFDFGVLELKIGNMIDIREAMKEKYSRTVSLEPNSVELNDPDAEFIVQLKDVVLKNISDTKFGVNQISHHSGVSVSVLYRKLRALTGMTVNDFVKSIRLKKAYQLLEAGHYNVNEVAVEVGFEDSQYFSKEFRKVYGNSPSDLKRQAQERKKKTSG